FLGAAVSTGYLGWPKLPEVMPSYFAGVQTKRDAFLIDMDRADLEGRIKRYFDPRITDHDLARMHPEIWMETARYSPEDIRRVLLARGILEKNIVRHAYRPFDTRWLYWEAETKLLGEKSPD